MRDDLERLEQVLASNPDYQVTVVWDRIVHCRQVRFAPRDPRVPGFVDLFPFDWVRTPDHDTFLKVQEYRRVAIEASEADERIRAAWDENVYVSADSEAGTLITKAFDDQLAKMREAGVVCSRQEAGGIVRAYDNMDHPSGFEWISAIDDIFPLPLMHFENRAYPVPANHMYLLSHAYGDIFSLPDDIGLHFEHVDRHALAEADANIIREYIER